MNRKDFIQKIGLAIAGSFCLPSLLRCSEIKPKVLVLGGTNYVGPAIVKSLLKDGFDVTLFNRGITNPELFPNLLLIKGDREKGIEGYDQLDNANTHWDAVIDVWPQNPNYVSDICSLLKNRTNHYAFISSVAVYQDFKTVGIAENFPVRQGNDYKKGHYGSNKVLCEKAIRNTFPENNSIFRCGAIVGYGDPGPFANYYIKKMLNEKEMIVADANDPVQFIDVDDLANFVTYSIRQKIYGNFNVTGPKKKASYKEMISIMYNTVKSKIKLHWIPNDYLLQEAKVAPFSELPFWIPISNDPEPGFYQISNAKAIEKGLKFSSFDQTVQRTIESLQLKTTDVDIDVEFGLNKEKELEIITAWNSKFKQ